MTVGDAREGKVTIGVMARAPVLGRCKTRLAATLGDEAATRLYEAMLGDSLDLFARVGATRLVIMTAPEDDGVAIMTQLAPPGWEVVAQEGAALGERLAHAFRTLGREGDAVLLVDSDSPTVRPEPIAEAVLRFHGPRRALMGPCDDGGYYLIGLTSLELGILDGIAWSTPQVAAQTRARCKVLGLALEELPGAFDVDRATDLARLRDELTAHPSRAPRTARALGLEGA